MSETNMSDTDKKMIMTDHDLLVRLNTTMDIFVRQQGDFLVKYDKQHDEVIKRITTLEIGQKSQATELDDVRDDIASLKTRSNWWDFINSGAVAISTVVGVIFGNRQV